jgi:tetratricopeptide (TPR) repeat protein
MAGRRYHGDITMVRMPRLPAAATVAIAAALVLAVAAVTAAQSLSLVVPAAGAAREAFLALEEGRFKDADAAFTKALATSPDDPALLLGAGLVARRLSDPARAQARLVRALEIDPALTPASQLLGTLLYEGGDIEGAIRVFDAALVRAPDRPQMLARVEEWRKEAALHDGFRRAQGGHFTVLFEGPAEETAANAAVEILEDAYNRIGDVLQAYPADPITVVLYTQQQFRDVTRTPGWSGGLFDGRIRLPIRGGLSDRGELARVLTHEYVHALVHGVAAGGVPAWLNEGLAAALEPGGMDRARRDIARSPAVLPLGELGASFGSLPASAVLSAYAGSALAVREILDRAGGLRLMGLFGDLGAGTDFDRAFDSWVQIPFDQFQQQWLTAVRESRAGR